jgi:hypothetical protein
MSSWCAKLERAIAERAKRDVDPLGGMVAEAVRGFDQLSTVSILSSIGLPPTTGNARRIAPVMRSLGFIGIKSRRLPPGGWNDTLCRGWARSRHRHQPDSRKSPADEQRGSP